MSLLLKLIQKIAAYYLMLTSELLLQCLLAGSGMFENISLPLSKLNFVELKLETELKTDRMN